MGTPRRLSEPTPMPPELAFDVTQEIDPALAELLQPARATPLLGADADTYVDLPAPTPV